MSPELIRLELGPIGTNCWLVADGTGGPLAVIDPAGDAETVLGAIAGRAVAAIVLTHAHFDHLGAAEAVMEATGAGLAVHSLDAAAVSDPEANGGVMFGWPAEAPAPDRVLADGDVVRAGALSLEVMHTPGHTPGSICLFLAGDEPHLFSGDTLFAGSVGRTDFLGGDARALARSIARLAALPPATRVHPGHGPDTTLERESRANFFWPRG